ncbi:MAG TPA: lysine 5,6-aminomutase subunit alpha, partial [Petrotogaceae bacterium]|nr:lysine 5,6-aminomutase subunit alpha [Petrotogaceae bacterium]
MESKLGIDFTKVRKARTLAEKIALDVQNFVKDHATTSTERTICRLLGIDGVNDEGIPLPNVLVDHLKENNALAQGAAYYIGNAMIETGMSPQEI